MTRAICENQTNGAVGAHPGPAIEFPGVLQHPDGVHHHWPAAVCRYHRLADVPVQPLFNVARADDARGQRSEDDVAPHEVLDERQHLRVVDRVVKTPGHRREIGDVGGPDPSLCLRSAVGVA